MAIDMSTLDPTDDNRPIEVGDYVRWEFPRVRMWAEGDVVDAYRGGAFLIMVARCAVGPWDLDGDPDPSPGIAHVFGVCDGGQADLPAIRRIPRPAQAIEQERAAVERDAARAEADQLRARVAELEAALASGSAAAT